MKRDIQLLDVYKYPHPKKKLKPFTSYGRFDWEFYDPWLNTLNSPSAIYLRDNLLNRSATNAYGLKEQTINPHSFMAWKLKEKQRYPRSILVIQQGDFFELDGIDSIFANEYAQLKIQGTEPKMKAGTPLASIQRLLDGLVEADLEMRVYEELEERYNKDPITKLKTRKLCQVVSKSNPVYFKAINSLEQDDSRNVKPLLFILSDKIVIVNLVTKLYYIYPNLNQITVKSLVNLFQPYHVYSVSKWNTLFRRKANFLTTLNIHTDIESILCRVSQQYNVEKDSFNYSTRGSYLPLLKSTSDQLGILSNLDYVPDLIDHSLGKSTNSEKTFFTNWILMKSSIPARNSMKKLCNLVSSGDLFLCTKRVLNPNTVYGILCSGGVCKDNTLLTKLLASIKKRVTHIDLHCVTSEYTGLFQSYATYIDNLTECQQLLESVLPSITDTNVNQSSIIPSSFLKRNEISIIKVNDRQYVEEITSKLEKLLESYNLPLTYNITENDIVLHCKSDALEDLIPAVNKRGKRNKCFTTADLNNLLMEYRNITYQYYRVQVQRMKELSQELIQKFGITIQLFLNSEVVLKCVYKHLSTVIRKGWTPADISAKNTILSITTGFPYWMSRESATTNSIVFKPGEMFILTAPNAYGKTTLIRSVVASLVLAQSGLYVPATDAKFPEITNIFIRLGSLDKPDRDLSSFETEIEDLQYMLERVDKNTLICLDELARTTCPREGETIAQAVLEFLISKEALGIFSTHLHKLLDIELKVTKITMSAKYCLELGECRTSLALDTCKKFKLCDFVINRAAELLQDTSKVVPINILDIAKMVCKINPVCILIDQLIPPIFTETTCVYLIQEAIDLWYVGETKNIIQRFAQHKQNKRTGVLYIFPVNNKSQALNYECLIQRESMKYNIRLSSTVDSYHTV